MNSQRGALGDVAPDEEDEDAEHRADPKGQTPADVDREDRRAQEQQRGQRARGGPDPVGPVDEQVHPPADPGGDELVDRGVDRRVLAPDARARDRAGEEEVPGREGERPGHRGGDVDAEREHEELLAPEAVGELSEEQRAEARPAT